MQLETILLNINGKNERVLAKSISAQGNILPIKFTRYISADGKAEQLRNKGVNAVVVTANSGFKYVRVGNVLQYSWEK